MKLIAIATLLIGPVVGQDLDCDPRKNAWEDPESTDQGECTAFGCTYNASPSNRLAPRCVYPAGWGYAADSITAELTDPADPILLKPTSTRTANRFDDSDPIWNVNLTVHYEGRQRLRLHFVPIDASGDAVPRYEIPEEIIKLNPAAPITDELDYKVKFSNKDGVFDLSVVRRVNETEIFRSNLPGFTMQNQFLEISLRCPTEYIYGFGEHEHATIKHNWDYYFLPMLTTPTGVTGADDNHVYKALYGHHPFFMGFDAAGHAYGVLFWNSNAQEVYLQPGNIMTFRSIGGLLDIRILTGPSPTEVFSQYHAMIGTPYFPPYWALGFQLSKYWYGSVEEVKNLRTRMTAAGIPWDVQQFDIDYMDRQRAFTTDESEKWEGLADHVEALHAAGMKTVVILDPAITSQEVGWTGYGTADVNYRAWAKLDEGDLHVKFIDDEDQNSPNDVVYGKVWPDMPNTTFSDANFEQCHGVDADWDSNVRDCRAWSAWPDFGLTETADWWVREAVHFWKGGNYSDTDPLDPANPLPDYNYGQGIKFDGIWIDMNEPENFSGGSKKYIDNPSSHGNHNCSDNEVDNMPYATKHQFSDSNLSEKSVCMSSQMRWGSIVNPSKYSFYDTRSLYSHSMALPSLAAANTATGQENDADLRSMVFSRATFAGTGALIGHWLGDNQSSWDAMRKSIIGIIEFNMFGIGYVGADICGFFMYEGTGATPTSKAPAELCYRWQQLGAFYTFSRNHATKHKDAQDPATYGNEVGVAYVDAVKRALKIKYEVMPYLYTTMYENTRVGGTTLKAMFEPFYQDKDTWEIQDQFMYGPAMMIAPVIEEGATNRTVYLPVGRWYDYYTRTEITYHKRHQARNVTFHSDPEEFKGDIPVYYRAGYIVPHQFSNTTLTESRKNPFYLVAALNFDNKAKGHLHWDTGVSVITNPAYASLDVYFSYEDGAFSSYAVSTPGYEPKLNITAIHVIGYRDWATEVDGDFKSFSQDPNTRILTFNLENQPIDKSFSINFKSFYGYDSGAAPRGTSAAFATALAVFVAASFAFRG